MISSVRKSFVLLPLLFAAAVPSMTWGQEDADSPAAEVFEGLGPFGPVGETNPKLPADPDDVFSDAAVDASVDSPVDHLFDGSLEAENAGVSPEPLSQGSGSGTRAPAPPQDAGKGIFQRRRLTGDWRGRRTALQNNGIRYRGRVTQYFFGVEGGIRPPVPPQRANLGMGVGDTFDYT
ncbi:MAG: hypothetical protein ACKV0T_10005 [Planctomycetales bacterium]